MTPGQLHIIIREEAAKYGFAAYGAARACKLDEDMVRLEKWLSRGFHADMGYMARNIQLREDPSLLLPGAKSVLCFLAPYKPAKYQDAELPQIAAYAYGEDYHKVIKDKLHLICKKIREYIPGMNARVFSDSAPVLERAWAAKAGLGFVGKSNFLISKTHGLHNLIGVIITDIETEYGEPVSNGCGSCTRCIESCPSGALTAPFSLDAGKCISYQTIESKKQREEEERLIPPSDYIFGCDICLKACPWSGRGEPTGWEEFKPLKIENSGRLITDLTTEEWEKMDRESFSTVFALSPLMRAGLEKIKNTIEYNSRKI